MNLDVTNEQARILLAVRDGRLTVNGAGRYVIDGQARPNRKERERLTKRGMIDYRFEQGRGSRWVITPRGLAALSLLGFAIEEETAAPASSPKPQP